MAPKKKKTPKTSPSNPYRIEWETAEHLDPVPTLVFFTKKPTDGDLAQMLRENPTVRIANPAPVDAARCTYQLENYGPWVDAKTPKVTAEVNAGVTALLDAADLYTKDPKRVLVQLSGEAFAKLAARARKKGVLPGTEAKVIVMAALEAS
jgi:hypothetical protein